nr:hypothetical protein Iba_chr08bCG0130 [Ipomoea batatas]GMD56037.1 hypothetical protein Iba_chr11dCG13760 [Ipomoea batatas]
MEMQLQESVLIEVTLVAPVNQGLCLKLIVLQQMYHQQTLLLHSLVLHSLVNLKLQPLKSHLSVLVVKVKGLKKLRFKSNLSKYQKGLQAVWQAALRELMLLVVHYLNHLDWGWEVCN